MRYGVRNLASGAADLARSLAMGDQLAQQAQQQEEERLGRVALTSARARKSGLEGDLLSGQIDARGGLGDALSTLLANAGGNGQSGAPLATAYTASGGNASQMGDLLATYLQQGRLGQAVDEPDATRSNRLMIAGGEKAYTPYTQTAGGLALDTGTGAQVQDSPAAQATIGDILASASAGRALAGERAAGTKTNMARTALLEAETANEIAGTRSKRTGRSGGKSSSGPKAADINAMYRQAAGLYGGVYDPATGRMQGLDKTTSAKVQYITARAEEIFSESGGAIGHANAVKQAAQELSIQFPEAAAPTDAAVLPGSAVTPSASAPGNDPLGLR